MKIKIDLFVVILIVALIVLLAGCTDSPQAEEPTSNPEYNVKLLFEKDGLKVYRFNDMGRSVYYIDGRGSTKWQTQERSGKSTIIRNHQVETEQ